ncbi:Nucleoprotein TPR [Blattella germanica]|nr:Nucleoprotein TPR [Blattella germanica]
MASVEGEFLPQILSKEECSKVPEDIRKKIDEYVKSKTEESVVSKALLETTRGNFESKISFLSKELATLKEEHGVKTTKLQAAEQELEDLRKKVQSSETELTKLRNSVRKLEQENIDFRRQRDNAIDERDSLQKMVDRRNTELQRLQDDVKMLNNQLRVAIDAKCEAIAKFEGVQSQQKQIQTLTEDLNKHASELMSARREYNTRLLVLESQLEQKTEELQIATQSNEDIKSTNVTLTGKLETLMQKLASQREGESKMRETFEQELQAQTRLANIYKGMSDDAEAKSEELTKAVTGLQQLLQEATKQHEESEAKMKELEASNEEEMSKKVEVITLLKKELDVANQMLKTVKQDTLDAAIVGMSPSAAAASRLLKSGMTLTQIYSQYVAIYDELMLEKEETKRLNLHMNTILEEIKERAPLLEKQKEDYERALENIATLTKEIDQYTSDCIELRREASEAQKSAAHHSHENTRLKQEMVDLAKQVCFLVKEVEEARGGFAGHDQSDAEELSDVTSSSQVISQKLVTFRSIEELQANNQKLLALVRMLSAKQEETDRTLAENNPEALLAEIEKLRNKLEDQGQMIEQQSKMLDTILRQRDTYQTLYQQQMDGLGKQKEESSPKGFKGPGFHVQGPIIQEKEKLINDLKSKLEASQKAFKELKEEMDTYRTERQANERILTDELDNLRKEMRELRTQNAKLLSQTEYNDERFKVLNANTKVYKSQIVALEEKNKAYSSTVIKHEQTIMHLKDETLDAQAKLSKAEVTLENLRRQCQILQETEARLLKEREVVNREKQSQSILLSNLESIRNSLERSEVEGKLKLEARLDETMRECGALRRRLQEEQDRFRELTTHLERKVAAAKKRQEEETSIATRTRNELNVVREELLKEKKEVENLTKRIREISAPPPIQKTPTETEILGKKIKDLELELNKSQSELKTTQQQLASAKQHAKQYSEIAEGTEKQFKEISLKFDKYKEFSEKKLSDLKISEEQFKKRVADLNVQISKLSAGTNQSTAELNEQLSKTRNELASALTELEQTKQGLERAQADLSSLAQNIQLAEEKYAHEVVLHSADIQQLSTLKEKVSELNSEVSELRLSKEKAENALNELKQGWEKREELLKKELEETRQHIKDMDSQNALLHDQIQALSSQLAILQASGVRLDPSTPSISGDSMNTSFSEEEKKSSEQLLQIVKYLRREKDIAISKYEVLRTENVRLKSQLEYCEKQLEDAKKSLLVEQEKTESSSVTAAKHTELLRKLETLNAIADSNRILREERDSLRTKVHELSEQVEKMEKELVPLRESSNEMSARVESMNAENVALRGEAGRLRQRVNFLIERSSKTSPEDWRRLQQERENLARQLTAEKDAHHKAQDENRGLKQEKSRLEEQLNALQRLQQQQSEEMKKRLEELNNLNQTISKLQQELNDTKGNLNKKNEELATITEDLGAKEAMLSDSKNKELQIRKIARRYKSQFEELTKTVEDERKALKDKEEAAAASAAATAPPSIQDIPPETQEQLRDEGRKEVELKIKEAENRHSDVTSVADKEERAKSVLKTARQKILQLTEAKNLLTRQLSEIQQNKEEQMNTIKAQYESRISHMEKEHADARAEKQQEKDRMLRDIETLNQRVNQLQRLVDKLQVSSFFNIAFGPVEKVNVEPPTANIKPMAGPSSTQSKQQPMQQSITVTPWPGRGETPLASIRPIQSTQVLVPPQQQLVHTTGSSSGTSAEGLSSSPTSSHTDYMPATSSAGPSMGPIRQVAVQPTQQATVTTITVGPSPSSREEPPLSAAESTQTKRPRGTQEMFQPVPSESGVDVEYQVPTSSQRDHEDEVVIVDSEEEDEEGMADEGVIEEPDDGPEFEEETDNGESYEVEGYDRDEQDLTAYDEGEGPDIDEETPPDQVNNEVEIIEDSNEVPNQSGSSIMGTVDNSTGQSAASSATVPVASSAEVLHPPQQQRSEATSSGSGSQAEGGNIGAVVTSQASPSIASSFTRGRHIPPLCSRQQQLLLVSILYNK